MSVLYALIPLAIVIIGVALMVFFWAVKNGQFDDLERQGSSILFDDDVNHKDPIEQDETKRTVEAETGDKQ